MDWSRLDEAKWIGLDYIELFGLDWTVMDEANRLDWGGLDWSGLDWSGQSKMDWTGVDKAKWIGLEWIELERIGLEWIGLEWIVCFVYHNAAGSSASRALIRAHSGGSVVSFELGSTLLR